MFKKASHFLISYEKDAKKLHGNEREFKLKEVLMGSCNNAFIGARKYKDLNYQFTL